MFEIGSDGLIDYEGRFDEDDFESAYRELERRYYAGEGAAYAEAGTAASEAIAAVNRGDFDGIVRRTPLPRPARREPVPLGVPGPLGRRVRASFEELNAMVARSGRGTRPSCWLSPAWGVTRHDREAVGQDGEQFAWARILVIEYDDGRLASLCDFEIEDEARGVRLCRGTDAGDDQPARGQQPWPAKRRQPYTGR